MRPLIDDSVFKDTKEHSAAFASAAPFKHVVIDNFLEPKFAQRLFEDFPAVKDTSKLVNEFGAPSRKSAISEVRGLSEPYVALDDYIQSKEFLDAMTKITGIADLCYDPWYFGAGTHENFHGASLDAHYDFNIHPKTGYHRRLNAIIYLNKDWDPDWGGEISFHTDPWDLKHDVKKSVQLAFNRCVVFETTENSWHSVRRVNLPNNLRHMTRKSFTIYLYTKTRPEAETAVEHGTVYVPPPLPERIQEGRTLSKTDMDDIEDNIARRHDYLRNLYIREYKFSQNINEMKAQIKELKKAQYVPILGFAKLKTVDSPLYPDGWMGEDLSFTVQLEKAATEFVLNVWREDDAGEAIKVSFEVGDRMIEQRIGGGMTRLKLTMDSPAHSEVQIQIKSDQTRIGGPTDSRQISLVVDSIVISYRRKRLAYPACLALPPFWHATIFGPRRNR